MSKKIVIATHAALAKGFQDCMKFLTGLGEDFITICAFTDVPEPKEEIQRFFASVSREDTVVVFTDLLGGSVNQMFASLLPRFSFHLIAGANLAVILAVSMLEEEDINEEKIRETIALCQKQMVYVNDRLKKPAPKEEENFFQ